MKILYYILAFAMGYFFRKCGQAHKKHDDCLCVPGSTKSERSVVQHMPAALRDCAGKLRARFGGAPIAVCIELSQVPIVSALL